VITSTPANPTNQTSARFGFSDTQAGVKFLCQLDGSAFSNCPSSKNYSSLSQGTHTFSVEAQDAAGNQSGAASFTWTIDTTAPPRPVITSSPTKSTNQTSASFSFTDTEGGVIFLCKLDTATFSACSSPITYPGPLSDGTHSFSVKAQDAAGNQSAAATYTWTVDTIVPPTPVITSTPANPTNQTSARFGFSDTQAGVKFLCQLDGSAFSNCPSPTTYSGLGQGSHTFSVSAQDTAGNQSAVASFTWTIL
jgi:large repetitive protein